MLVVQTWACLSTMRTFVQGAEATTIMKVDRTDREENSGVQVIDRAAQILNALEGKREGLSIAELAKAAEIPRPTVQRIALSLQRAGLLARIADSKRFALGNQLLRLAFSVHVDVIALAQPILHQLSLELKETVHLLAREGRFVVCIAQARFEQDLQVAPKLGARLHLHASASGKALLAAMPESEAKRLLNGSVYKRMTPTTRVTWQALLPDLGAARAYGISFDMEESIEGVAAISTVVGIRSGQPHALTVPLPVQRLAAKRTSIERALLRARREWEAKVC